MSNQAKDLKTAAKVITQDSARRFVKRATYYRLNNRRCELIDRDIDGNCSPAEKTELATLEGVIERLVDLVCPLPPLDPLVSELYNRPLSAEEAQHLLPVTIVPGAKIEVSLTQGGCPAD